MCHQNMRDCFETKAGLLLDFDGSFMIHNFEVVEMRRIKHIFHAL